MKEAIRTLALDMTCFERISKGTLQRPMTAVVRSRKKLRQKSVPKFPFGISVPKVQAPSRIIKTTHPVTSTRTVVTNTSSE